MQATKRGVKLYRQVRLRDGDRELVTNLPDSPKLRRGNSVNLPELGPAMWEIVWLSSAAMPRPHADWRVGGLA